MPSTQSQHLSAAKASRNYSRTVNYVNAKGRTITAAVVGGSGATLNLRLPSYPQANRELTGIAKRTGIGQTNVWF